MVRQLLKWLFNFFVSGSCHSSLTSTFTVFPRKGSCFSNIKYYPWYDVRIKNTYRKKLKRNCDKWGNKIKLLHFQTFKKRTVVFNCCCSQKHFSVPATFSIFSFHIIVYSLSGFSYFYPWWNGTNDTNFFTEPQQQFSSTLIKIYILLITKKTVNQRINNYNPSVHHTVVIQKKSSLCLKIRIWVSS